MILTMADNILDQHYKKQEELISRLNIYAQSIFEQDKIALELEFLSNIYSGEFRHDYSDFLKLIGQIDKDPKNKSFDFLQSNLEMIKTAAHNSKSTPDLVCKSILKLCDHINLEIIRHQANQLIYTKLENKTNEAKQQLLEYQTLYTDVKNELEASKSKLDEANHKISRMQGESIAIISIFLAFTLAFTGGLSYISSAISSLATAPIERIITIVILCGLIVFNTMYTLLHIVSRLIGKQIDNDSNNQFAIKGFNNKIAHFIKKYKLFLIVNLILISFLIYPFIKCVV